MSDSETNRANEAAQLVIGEGVELLHVTEACKLLGGDRPINPSTLYRGIQRGIYPKPVRFGPKNVRWIKSELIAAIRAMIAERDKAA